MQIVKKLIVAILLILSFTGCSGEQSSSYLFLGNHTLAPILYENRGKAEGLVVDIIKEVEKRIDQEITIQLMDWGEAQTLMQQGRADALLQINPSPRRMELYDFSDELLVSDFSLFIRQGTADIQFRESLAKKSIGVLIEGYPFRVLKDDETITLVLLDDLRQGFTALKAGEIDVLIVDRWIGEYELAQSRITGIVRATYQLDTLSSRIAVQKGDELLLSQLNAALSSMHEDQSMQKILDRYAGKQIVYLTHDTILNALLHGVGFTLLILLLVSLLFVRKYRGLSKQLEIQVKKRTEELAQSNKDLIEANYKLKLLSHRDGLTKLANRRYFDEVLRQVWDRCLETNQSVALLMLDIDDFKAYNDTYGHIRGDDCLKRMANLVEKQVAETEALVARYGGEEFVLLLEGSKYEDAIQLAEQIRSAAEQEHNENPSFPTISIGVYAVYPQSDLIPEDLVSHADSALYRAKAAGKNTIA